jgi:hypothetical protein
MVIFSKEQITKYTEQLQNAIAEQVDPENPVELRRYLQELSAYLGLVSGIVASARHYKDKNKSEGYLLDGANALASDMHYRINAVQSILGYHKAEIQANF